MKPTPAQPPAVEFLGLAKTLDDRPILEDLDLSIPRGQFVALLGANGAGKSTLLKIVSGLLAPSEGEVRLFGKTHREGGGALRVKIGLLGHQSMLYRDLSARENLVFFAKLYDCPDPEGRAETLLETVGLADRADDPVRNFSRGMTQRISIARALVHDPELILADEPFAGLDVPSTASIEKLLQGLHANGKTILLVNHDLAQSIRLAQRVIVLFAGQIALDRPAKETAVADVVAAMSGDSLRVGSALADAVALDTPTATNPPAAAPFAPVLRGEGGGEGPGGENSKFEARSSKEIRNSKPEAEPAAPTLDPSPQPSPLSTAAKGPDAPVSSFEIRTSFELRDSNFELPTAPDSLAAGGDA